MAPKRKEADAVEEVATKAAKVEEKDVEMKEEEPKEKETDDKKDARPATKEAIGFDATDTTLNVIPTHSGRALMCMSDGGMQFLIAGARANVGMKSGRYFYEVKIIEALNHWTGNNRNPAAGPAQLVRLGFSTAGSSLILGEDAGGVCIDSEGRYTSFPEAGSTAPKKVACGQQIARETTVGVLLNLDAKSPNANTLSLFKNGERLCEPQALPEHLKGKVLYPHVAFRNVTVHVNFGVEAMSALPFKCRMLQEAAEADVKNGKAPAPKGGKYDVLYPVGFPDEGTFEWLDGFLKKNPQYVELSDRSIQDWISKSGISKSASWNTDKTKGTSSNDKPVFNYGSALFNDSSIRRAVMAVAPHFARHYVMMEVKENLVEADRLENLKRFNLPHFKRIAYVVMGEPKGDFKERVHAKLLIQKQARVEEEWTKKKSDLAKKKLDKERKKQIAERQKKIAEENRLRREAAEQKRKELAEKRAAEADAKKAEVEAKKAEAEAKKKEEEDAKKKEEGDAPPAEGAASAEEKKEEKKDGDVEMKTEEKKEEPKVEEKKEEPKVEEVKKEEPKVEEVKKEEEKKEEPESEDEVMADEPPPAVLTAEEKKTNFLAAPAQKDLLDSVLNAAFGSFSLPEKTEGFDEVKYEWDDAAKSKAYLKRWVLDRKITSRIEDIVPGEWFGTTLADFTKSTDEYQAKQKTYNMNKAKAVPKKKDEEEDEEKKKPEGDAEGDEEVTKKEEPDIFTVKDICDIGEGEPLFANFVFEDWMLFTLRFELYLLTAAFKKDVDDPERVGIHQAHFAFYYNRYFKRQFMPRAYGKDSLQDVLELVKDTVELDSSNGVLVCKLSEDKAKDIPELLKLQEENRRERQRRIDAGDETVRINFDILRQQLDHQAKQTAISAARALEAAKHAALDGGAGAASTGAAAWTPAPRTNQGQGAPAPVLWKTATPAPQAWASAGTGGGESDKSWGNQPAKTWGNEQGGGAKGSWSGGAGASGAASTWSDNQKSDGSSGSSWSSNEQKPAWGATQSPGQGGAQKQWEYAPRTGGGGQGGSW